MNFNKNIRYNLNIEIDKFIKENTNNHLCQCNCGNYIIIRRYHFYRGIPKYISGHNSKKIHPSYGKCCTEETRKKLSQSHIGLGCGENNPNWKGGKSFEPYCPRFNEKKKEEVRNEYDRKCYFCQKDEKDNITKNGKKRKLSIHHLDMDKEQGCNGKSWKLVPLCVVCHTKLHFKKMEII